MNPVNSFSYLVSHTSPEIFERVSPHEQSEFRPAKAEFRTRAESNRGTEWCAIRPHARIAARDWMFCWTIYSVRINEKTNLKISWSESLQKIENTVETLQRYMLLYNVNIYFWFSETSFHNCKCDKQYLQSRRKQFDVLEGESFEISGGVWYSLLNLGSKLNSSWIASLEVSIALDW